MFRASQAVPRLAARSSRLLPVSRPLHRQQPAFVAALTRQQIQRPPQLLRPTSRSFATSKDDPPPPRPSIDRKAEREVGKQKLQPTPGGVSTQSSTRPTVETGSQAPKSDDEDVSRGIREELEIVRDTFRLGSVPRESHILGLAGTVPYLFTSMSTVYLAWDLSQTWPTGSAIKDTILINHDTARYLIGIIEPLQLGYGAVIISFLGAIHWGLEYAETKPLRERTRFRYGIGLAASVVAWPTILMPVPYALTTQFMAFVALYFADARAATRGWAPSWYGTYRFLLTAMVGLAILVSLVGRSHISESSRLSGRGLRREMNAELADHDTDWAKLEQKEKEKNRKKKKQAEEKKKEEEEAKAKKEEDEQKDDKDKQAGKEEKPEEGKPKEQKTQDESKQGDNSETKDNKEEGDAKEKGGDKE